MRETIVSLLKKEKTEKRVFSRRSNWGYATETERKISYTAGRVVLSNNMYKYKDRLSFLGMREM